MKTIINKNGCILKTENIINCPSTFKAMNDQVTLLNHRKIGYTDDLIKELEGLDYVKEFGRLVAWQGNKSVNYKYTNKHHIARGWTLHIDLISETIRQFLQTENWELYFNHCLINKYESNMSLNPHKDNEPELKGAIASLTLGDSANFIYGKDYPNNVDRYNSLQLNHGDVMIGNRKFFNDYYHSVTKPINGKTRYCLTWRTI